MIRTNILSNTLPEMAAWRLPFIAFVSTILVCCTGAGEPGPTVTPTPTNTPTPPPLGNETERPYVYQSYVYQSRGDTYVEQGEHQKAITEYSTAIELEPERLNAYLGRGYAYNQLGEYRKAIADFDKAILLDPGHAKAYYNRGIAHDELGEYQKAIDDYRKVLEITDDPDLTRDAQAALEGLEVVNDGILDTPEERTSLILLCYSLHEHYSQFSPYFDAEDAWDPDLEDGNYSDEVGEAINFSIGALALRDSVDELPVARIQAANTFLETLKKVYKERFKAFYHLALHYKEGEQTNYKEFETSWKKSGHMWEQAWDEWENIAVAYDFDSVYCDRTGGRPDLSLAQDPNEDLSPEAVMANIEGQVSALRGWQLEDEPERRLMTREELRDYNEEHFLEDNTQEEMANDARPHVLRGRYGRLKV